MLCASTKIPGHTTQKGGRNARPQPDRFAEEREYDGRESALSCMVEGPLQGLSHRILAHFGVAYGERTICGAAAECRDLVDAGGLPDNLQDGDRPIIQGVTLECGEFWPLLDF